MIVKSKNNNNNPNGIHVLGSLIIDSVKITSWDLKKNDVVKFSLGKRPGEEDTKSEYDTVESRPFIRVSDKASGTTNITNSEIHLSWLFMQQVFGIKLLWRNWLYYKGK